MLLKLTIVVNNQECPWFFNPYCIANVGTSIDGNTLVFMASSDRPIIVKESADEVAKAIEHVFSPYEFTGPEPEMPKGEANDT